MKKIRNREIRGVVFDMDGLMFDSERIVKLSWDVAGEELGYGKLGDNIVNTLGFNVDKRKAYFQNKYGETFPFEPFLEHYRAAFHRYEEEHGIPVKKGLHELLKTLKELEIPMAVATSSSHQYAMKNLEREGIVQFFACIVTGGMVTEAKPSPEIYRKACEGLQISPSYGLALEDSYNGIRSAYSAGMKPIMVPDLLPATDEMRSMSVAVLEDLIQVKEYFA